MMGTTLLLVFCLKQIMFQKTSVQGLENPEDETEGTSQTLPRWEPGNTLKEQRAVW